MSRRPVSALPRGPGLVANTTFSFSYYSNSTVSSPLDRIVLGLSASRGGSGTQTGAVAAITRFGDDDWVPIFTMTANGQVGGTWAWRSSHRYEPWWLPYIEVMKELSDTRQVLDASKGFPLSRWADQSRLDALEDAVLAVMDRIDEAT